jgi:hypothetical protein
VFAAPANSSASQCNVIKVYKLCTTADAGALLPLLPLLLLQCA